MSHAPDSHAALRRFPTTDWSLVVSAGNPDAVTARESLGALRVLFPCARPGSVVTTPLHQTALSPRACSNTNPARPYICRFIFFNLFT